MHQISGATAVNGHFVDGTSTESGTVVKADWLNTIQDELCNLITSSGIPLNTEAKEDCNQIKISIDKMITNSISNFVIQNNFNELASRVAWCEEKINKIIGKVEK